MATAIRTGSSHQGAFLRFFSGRRRQNCQRGGGGLDGGGASVGACSRSTSVSAPDGAGGSSSAASGASASGASAGVSASGESAGMGTAGDSTRRFAASDATEGSTVNESAGSPFRAASSDSSWPARASPEPAPRCACSSAMRSSSASSSAGDRLPLLLDLGGLAPQVSQVVELGSAYIAPGNDFDLVDDRRVYRERAFDANPETDLAHGERFAQTATLAADHDSLEDLDTRAGTLDHADVDLQGVAGPELGYVGTQRLGIHGVERVHRSRILRSVCSWPACMSVVPTLTGSPPHALPGAGQPLDGAIRGSPARNRALPQ